MSQKNQKIIAFNNCPKTRIDRQIDEMQESIADKVIDIMNIAKHNMDAIDNYGLKYSSSVAGIVKARNGFQLIYETTKNLASDLQRDARL